MKILSIGNSYSVDAQHYLYLLSREAKFPLTTGNLYIGGCPLSRHYRNMQTNEAAYQYYFNGVGTNRSASLREGVLADDWDVITLQQASYESQDYANYQPFLSELAAYVRRLAPKARLMLHQTWTCGASHERVARFGYGSASEMFSDIAASYAKAAEAIGAAGIIPAGAALEEALRLGAETVHAPDGIHASAGLGRLTLAETWLSYLSGKDLRNVKTPTLDVAISEQDIELAKLAAYNAVTSAGKTLV